MDAFIRNQNGNWLREHLEKFFPARCTSLGPEGVASWMEYGKKKAAAYGFMQADEVCRYLDFMFALGRDFDTDSQYPWASTILNDQRIPDAGARMDLLTYTAKAELTANAEAPVEA